MAKAGKKRHTGIINKLLLLINVVLAADLLVSYLSPYVNPQSAWLPAFMGLIWPFLFFANLLFVVWWVIRRRLYFLISLAVMFLGWNMFFRHFQFNVEKPVGNYEGTLKLFSYNVRLFDQHLTGGKDLFKRNAIFSLIKSENPGVACFQEFFHGNSKYFPTLEPFLEMQETRNYHVDYIKQIGDRKHYGLATFTKYPIVGKGVIRFEKSSSNSGIFTDVLFAGDTIRIFNFHLESIRLSKSDHRYVAEFMDPSTPVRSSSSKVIIAKLINAFQKRAAQAETVAGYLKESPYPVIVCGDFNDTPASYVYETISDGLNDAFLSAGQGYGTTYAGSFPFLRIDYILYSPELEAYRYSRYKAEYSDHYPISCYFRNK